MRESLQADISEVVVPVAGDMLEHQLGMSEEDTDRLLADTQVVFHSAATVNFDEKLKLSVRMNVIGVKKIVELSRKMKHLECLIHVSTAYANCNRDEVGEVVYDPPLQPSKLVDAVEWMGTDHLDVLTGKLIGSRPNTYTYTKALAECLFAEETKGMRTAIVRPSIVGASWNEPLPGWVDNLNGPTGLVAASGKGLLFVMKGDQHSIADIVPVDIVTNAMIAVAWHTASLAEAPDEPTVYNVTTGQINKLTWGNFQTHVKETFMEYPCTDVLKVPNPRLTRSAVWRDTCWFLEQMVPAYTMDAVFRLTGRKPMFVRMQDRLSKATKTLEFFTSHEWNFQNDNLFALMSKMSEADKAQFCFDPRRIEWKKYINNYCLGIQQFILKEDVDNRPKARTAFARLKRFQLFMKALGGVLVWHLLAKRVYGLTSLWNLLLDWVQFLLVRCLYLARR